MMMAIGPVGAAVFIVAWVLLVASMVYSVVEGVSFFVLQPWVFRHGPIVLRQHRLSPNLAARTSRTIQLTESGRFRFIEPNMAVFCFGRSWFSTRLRTAVFGSINLDRMSTRLNSSHEWIARMPA